MNKFYLTSILGVALLLASAAPVLAHETGLPHIESDAAANVEVRHEGEPKRPGLFAFPKLRFLASTSVQKNTGHSSTTEKRIEKAGDKAIDTIDKRIESLEKLSDRLANIQLLEGDVLAKLQASISAQIAALTELKTNLASSTATTTLKAVTKINHAHLLAEPKARIAAAASRINAVVTQFGQLITKFEARISAAQTAGVDVTAAAVALADLKVKIAEAKLQADAAVALTASLPDAHGDAAIAASNRAALKAAGQKLVLAQKALAAARHDAATIVGIVKKKDNKGVHATSTATTTATTTP